MVMHNTPKGDLNILVFSHELANFQFELEHAKAALLKNGLESEYINTLLQAVQIHRNNVYRSDFDKDAEKCAPKQ